MHVIGDDMDDESPRDTGGAGYELAAWVAVSCLAKSLLVVHMVRRSPLGLAGAAARIKQTGLWRCQQRGPQSPSADANIPRCVGCVDRGCEGQITARQRLRMRPK